MSATKYTIPHIILHWAIAALVTVQLLLADRMSAAFDQMMENITPAGAWTSSAVVHAVLGVAIGLLMVWRLMLSLTTETPPPARTGAVQTLSRATHGLFYVLLIGMPFAGALAWFIPSQSLGNLHSFAGNFLIALILLHIGGALYHHYIAGEKTILRRMFPR